jgi:hypothetical protein
MSAVGKPMQLRIGERRQRAHRLAWQANPIIAPPADEELGAHSTLRRTRRFFTEGQIEEQFIERR